MESPENPDISYEDPSYIQWWPVIRTQKDGRRNDRPLNFHKCTEQDIKSFYPPSKSYLQEIEAAWSRNHFFCLDDNQNITIYGTDATDHSRLDLNLMPCAFNNKSKCPHSLNATQNYLKVPAFKMIHNTVNF